MASIKLFFTLILAAFLGLGLPAASAEPAGNVLNLNPEMELGTVGQPGVPGYRLDVNGLLREEADLNPDRFYLPMTVERQDQPGQCLKVPGYRGVLSYRMELADLYFHRDGEVEISFDARRDVDEQGQEQPESNCFVDFRAMPNPLAGETYYPMLTSFSFKPTSQWQHFAKRYSVTARSNFFSVWVISSAGKPQKSQNALYLDNFMVRRVEPKTTIPDQAAVIPDRTEPVYAAGDPIALTIRASVAAAEKELDARLAVRSDLDDSLVAEYPVTLKRIASLSDGRWLYQGELRTSLSQFGTFHCDMQVSQQKLAVVGGLLAVLHPVVRHERFSFGWGIGSNLDTVPLAILRVPHDYRDYRRVPDGSLERSFRIAQQAGLSLQRVWGHWRYLEPQQGEWKTDVIDSVMKLSRQYHQEVIYVLAANLTVHGGKQGLEQQVQKGTCPWPSYLLPYYRGDAKVGFLDVPSETFAQHLDFVVKHWGDQIHLWEVFNEPGIGGFPASAYLKYLKQVYQTVKKHDPSDLVLGNGVTGDFGMNVIKWCEELNRVNPDYPNDLDGVAFHPYAVALDYQNGHYNAYTKCIADINSKLKIKKPLWNTECYYLIDARRPQIPFYLNQAQYGANEIQRHILEGMLNGVAATSGIDASSLVQRTAPAAATALSQVAAGTNTLSWLLKNMKHLEALALNNYMRAGLFTDAEGKNGLGFLYDLRPEGSDWQLPADRGGVQVMDLFGNPVSQTQNLIHLSYEPHYLRGSPAAIRALLNPATLRMRRTMEITGRMFRDVLYLEGRNISGVDAYRANVAVQPVQGLVVPEKIEMAFTADRERDGILIQNALRSGFDPSVAVTWRNMDGDTSGQYVRLLPDTGTHDIPMAPQSPLKLPLGGSGKVSMVADEKNLVLTVEVTKGQLDAAKAGELWNGDAVEVFIDPHPFEKLDCSQVFHANQSLDVWQHIFAAVVPQGGSDRQVVNRSRPTPLASQASHVVTSANGGYAMTISIPWTEILSRGNMAAVIGMDVEVDHADAGKVQKESLGNKPGQSFCERLHYPLFRIPDAVIRRHRPLLQDAVGTHDQPVTGCFRIDLSTAQNQIPLAFDSGSPSVRGMTADWLKNDKDKRLVVLGSIGNRWQPMSFAFTPKGSGKVLINLMGDRSSRGDTWCCLDQFEVKGALGLSNGGFEQVGVKGLPDGWTTMNHPNLIRDVAMAAHGNCYVTTNHDNRLIQAVTVEKDKKVTVSFWARVLEPQVVRMP